MEKIAFCFPGQGSLEAGKLADLIVINDVGRADVGFDAAENEALILRRDGEQREIVSQRPKREVAETLAQLRTDNERELDRANQLFGAWRASTLETTKELYDELVDVASLPRWYQARTWSRFWHGGDESPGGPQRTSGCRRSA